MKLVLAALLTLTIGGCASRQEVEASRNPTPASNPALPPVEGLACYPGATLANTRQTDEGGFHIREVDLSTPDAPDKVQRFYEPLLSAKSMPMESGVSSIQNDTDGKHYEVTYSRFGDETTIQIIVKTPSQP